MKLLLDKHLKTDSCAHYLRDIIKKGSGEPDIHQQH